MNPDPCHCPTYDATCTRAGHPMSVEEWEGCSGNCPALLAKNPQASVHIRHEYDRRAAAIAAGQNPFPGRKPGLGDWFHALLVRIGFRRQCKGCRKRQQKLNRFGRWLLSFLRPAPPAQRIPPKP